MDNDTRMSEFIERAEGLLAQMEASNQKNLVTHEMHEAQLKLYREMVTDSLSLAERRWNGVRNVLVSIGLLFLASAFGGGMAVSQMPTHEDIQNLDYANKGEILRAFGVVTYDFYDTLEHSGVLTSEEAEAYDSKVKSEIVKEILPDYVTRGAKTINVTK